MEQTAAKNVLRQGCDCYCPMFAEFRPQRGRLIQIRRVLFPGYLFVSVLERWSFLHGTRGVLGLVMAGEHPAILPTSRIEMLRAREGADGMIVLDNVRDSTQRATLRSGQSVRVVSGPMSGHDGIVQGMRGPERVVVLFGWLRTTLDRDSVVPSEQQ